MPNISQHTKTLEKLSLITCSNEVMTLFERSLKNVEPIVRANTSGIEPLLWQNDLDIKRLHNDQPKVGLNKMELKQNAAGFYEDYIAVGLIPKARDNGNK